MVETKNKTKNVVDFMKDWDNVAIKSWLDKRRFNYSILCSNVKYNLNLGNVIRSGNIFLTKQVILYGRRKWDKRPAVGCFLYENLKFFGLDQLEELKAFVKGSRIIGLENSENAKNIRTFDWKDDRHTILVIGQESEGICKELLDLCEDVVYIKQFGATRCLNVASAAAIAMNEIANQLS